MTAVGNPVYVVVSTSHDPNWFYSTLAQSTAAIVRLAGGFLVSRLIARRAEIGVERASLATSFASIVGEFAGEANRYEEAGSWPSSQTPVSDLVTVSAGVDAGPPRLIPK